MHIYLDACCLSRPFDDQSIDRNRVEAEIILTLFRRFRQGLDELAISDVLEYEVGQTHDREQREAKLAWLLIARAELQSGPCEDDKAAEFVGLGFKAFDAMHIACAESLKCTVLLTTDDRLLRLANRHQKSLDVRVCAPIQYAQENLYHEHN